MPNTSDGDGELPPVKREGRQRRKPTIWSREKISKLIELYRDSDCLWNHFSELYKNKDCRAKAIAHICTTLGITKNDYGKKVHNLRNQFNSELKKLERRLEESGGSSSSQLPEKTCRWEHFKTLMFLRSVIEPRPGYQQSSQCKKIAKLDYSYTDRDEDVEKPTQSSVESLESIFIEAVIESEEIEKVDEPKPMPMPALSALATPSPVPSRLAEPPAVATSATAPVRDQWDAFGELIACEFRNLNSELSRKRLKRKIMQVMLEIGEEDDLECPGPNS
ncbi:uncharacterized protein [Drosophila kikkawai]|uniref:MADF domain-containing protein n=1 Tax=Drosophila kikkawai TaxID=30033 RepID=A0A6P4I4C0_DROKI|nr:uncharacterized protein LOC108072167 [Drosophila kikkawai]